MIVRHGNCIAADFINYAKRHKETAYSVHLPKLAKAKAAALKLTGQPESQDVGQAADDGKNGHANEKSPASVSA